MLHTCFVFYYWLILLLSNSFSLRLFLYIYLHPWKFFSGSSVNNAATFLMKTLLNNSMSESVKILFASVIQHEDLRPGSQTVAQLSSGLARNGFYRSELQTKLSSSFSEGKWAYAQGKWRRNALLRTVAWWEKLNVGLLWAAHISALMLDRCEVLCRAGRTMSCDWAVLIGIIPCGRVRLAEVDRTWAASCRDYISRLDNLKCHIWGRVLKRCHSAFKVDYWDV